MSECDVCCGQGTYPIIDRYGCHLYEIACPECLGDGKRVEAPEPAPAGGERTMSGCSTVYRGGSGRSVRASVMEQMGLHAGQSIGDEQAWKIIELNVAAFVADMDLRRAAGEADIPDCSELKAQLARIATGKS